MRSNTSKLLATALAAALLTAVPTAAAAGLDYSKNSVSGQYSVSAQYHDPPALRGVTHLDYSRNSVSGENNAVTAPPASSTAPARVVKSASGFSWSAAGAGAGATLLTVTLALGVTRLRRRHPGTTVRTSSPMLG